MLFCIITAHCYTSSSCVGFDVVMWSAHDSESHPCHVRDHCFSHLHYSSATSFSFVILAIWTFQPVMAGSVSKTCGHVAVRLRLRLLLGCKHRPVAVVLNGGIRARLVCGRCGAARQCGCIDEVLNMRGCHVSCGFDGCPSRALDEGVRAGGVEGVDVVDSDSDCFFL